jgi:antirestriction protein ArdC
MFRNDRNARAGSDRASLYDDITGKIIAELEAGRFPWVQPWGSASARRRSPCRGTPRPGGTIRASMC